MSGHLLGVHLIVRNEEELLARCLESIRPIADELIVVDTGSTDGTVDIALAYGAVVLTEDWTDDFAKARNVALSRSEAEWVLVLDADEAVTKGADRLRACLTETKANALTVEMRNRTSQQPWDCVTFHPVRLFRRGSANGYHFEGRIHEQLISREGHSIPEAEIGSSPLEVVHDGYLPGQLAKKQKAERNARIVGRILEERPGDPFQLYNLGVTWCQLRMPEKAADMLALAIKNAPLHAAYRPTLIRDMAKVGIELGRAEMTIQLLQSEIRRYPDYPDLHHLLGEALAACGRLQEAYEAYRRAVQCGQMNQRYVTEAGSGGFRTQQALARIARKLGSLRQATEWYEACAAEQPLYEQGLQEWADVLQEMGVPDKTIAERLQAALAPLLPKEEELLARLLTRLGAYSEALGLMKRMEFSSPGLQQLEEECLLQTGQLREAFKRMVGRQAGTAEENKALCLDAALCCWSEELDFPYRFFKRLTPAEQRVFEELDRYVQGGESDEKTGADPEAASLIPELLERAVKRKLTRIARKLSGMDASYSLLLAKILYRHGFVLLAADDLLACMKAGTLDEEGLYLLAEMIYDKGHFNQAAALLEELLDRSPGNERARLGVSLCYLQLARETLLDSLEKAPHHPVFQQDLQRVDTSIRLLHATGWHTSWDAAERRNKHAAPPDFAVHDR